MRKHAQQLLEQSATTVADCSDSPELTNARLALAALLRWNDAGRPVERLRPEDIRPLPVDLRLADAPLRRPAMGYQMPDDRGSWIVVARVAARDPTVPPAGDAWAYAEPMLCYAGRHQREFVSGCINLGDEPTPADIKVPDGHRFYVVGWADELDAEETTTPLMMLEACLSRYYGLVRPDAPLS
ncbi:MAG: hypothetical protein AAF916_04205 [Planctomycetota bacterium]